MEAVLLHWECKGLRGLIRFDWKLSEDSSAERENGWRRY
jgi:hypothetical protein